MNDARIDIAMANELKQFLEGGGGKKPKLIFTCPVCEQTVVPHRDGQPKQGPHFEHLAGNEKNCPVPGKRR